MPRICPPLIVANKFGSAMKHKPLLPDCIISMDASDPIVANRAPQIAVEASNAAIVSDKPCVTVVKVISEFAFV